MSVRIVCINKDNGYHENPYEAIETLGWVEDGTGSQGKSSRLAMYDWIERGGYAYVQQGVLPRKVKVITAVSQHGTKYVKTEADYTDQNNLLKLPECR